jgi:hypothetical protein
VTSTKQFTIQEIQCLYFPDFLYCWGQQLLLAPSCGDAPSVGSLRIVEQWIIKVDGHHTEQTDKYSTARDINEE